ncbi:DUF4082 domain-containing protein [Microlunatus flavus]|uniref:Ig-like domain-containing protein n=1 Tax=Microlunatus flavus TaxID=1036181 RepID=A0A1H9DHM9_9ACTN|nr:DUF4082 domain-containing protein [Microlunatus flavus]SEQ13012.1 Ig-like domain-containing protein [Microlunatus flavus]
MTRTYEHATLSSSTARTVKRRWTVVAAIILAMVASVLVLPAERAAAACSGNAIVCENQLPGTPQSVWDVDGVGDTSIQGFATATSVNAGSRIDFKIDTDARAYTVEIYRLGWYQGNGARLVTTISPSVPLPQTQAPCATDDSTQLVDCGTWAVSASWNVPSTSVSGVYIARLIRSDTKGDSHIPFVVRNDGNTSAAVFQTSDSTWQAYNMYGGSNFYQGGANGRAYKLSYNRPYSTRGYNSGRDFLFSNEYPMLRTLEQNGVDVSYVSGIDVATDPALLPKHKVFLSVGHDEYWTASQRKNVTDARDAKVNLAFFGGNDVYWKTLLEPSQDGTSTPNRTLVDYKDTWANKRIDRPGTDVQATWRDPRFGDLGYGYGPENALIGTQYQANFDDFPIQVSSAEGKLRIWRGSALASLPSGTTASLSDHTVGYESNEDVDNGSRPAGLIRMSTATGSTPEYLMDFGNQVQPSTTTHHITLYRAASGALVFSAGTIQWSWGLDSAHDGAATTADPRMRQATINVLTDMSAPATTPAPGIAAVTPSTDITPPTVSIVSPTAGKDLSEGSLLTVSGTASDVGGQVAGVEVSVDGGASFHPADGTTTWSYTGILTGNGANAVQVRATDDSARTSAPVSVAVNSACPCTLFGVATPKQVDSGDTDAVTLGTKFTTSTAGFVSGVRFYKSSANTGSHTGTLYSSGGAILAAGVFANETSSGWQTLVFDKPVAVQPGTTYVAGYSAPKGHYSADSYFFTRSFNAGNLTAAGGAGVDNGVFANGAAFPSTSYRQTNYYVDPVFSLTDTSPLTVVAQAPKAGASSVATTSLVTATFSKPIDPASVTLQVVDAAQNLIPGTTTWDSTNTKVTFNPAQGLGTSTTYTVTVNASTLAAPTQWSFTTVDPDGIPNDCPCTLFNDTDQPVTGPENDAPGVKLGTAFVASQNGQVSAVRFYKRFEDVGPHTVDLWSGTTKVAEAVTTTESSMGWQQATFSAPQQVTKGATYVVSYTSNGRYGYTANGLSGSLTNGPLSTPANGGRYTYTASAAPTSGSSANYFVDPVFTPAGVRPTVLSTSPGNGATSVPVDDKVQVMFGVPIQPGSATIVVKRISDGATVAGNNGTESQGSTATFVPSSSLDPGAKYSATVSGAISADGAKMSGSVTFTFTTSGAAACPCSLLKTTTQPAQGDSGDKDAVTLGLKFTPTTNGYVKGLRYWRDASNTGTHTGTLYSATGDRLADLTFDDNGTGWQTASFSSTVPVTAGTTYVAAYYAPNGHYSADLNYFASPVTNTPLKSVDPSSVYHYGDGFPNQTYANTNYYVDVVFDTNNDAPLTVSSTSPAKDATGVATTTAVTATFSAAIDPASLQLALADQGGAAVPGQVAYDATSRTATFTTASPLLGATVYTATANASSASGVAMASPKAWSFTTADTQPPTVTTVSPADAASGVPTSTKVTAAFASPIDPASALFTVSRTSDATVVPGATTYDATTRTATFSPGSALASNTGYTVSVSARNTSGISMSAPKTWTFSTADTDPPSVASTSPAPGATAVAPTTKVTASFVRAVDPTSVVLGVKNTATSAAVAGTTAYDATTRTATFTPSAALASLTGFTASVTASNVSGVAMTAPTTWTFTTADAAAPSVSSTSPAAGATGVGAGTSVTATFARAIDPASVVLTLKTSAGASVAGTTTYDATSRTATFKPGSALASFTSHTASVTAKNTSGVAMTSPTTWSFTTADTDQPSVSAKSPAAGATNVAASTNVTATFARAINSGTLAVTLKSASGTTVPGAVSYSATTRTATFNPTSDLTSSTSYTASVSASNTSGVPMASPVTWSFTTAAQTFSLYTTTRTPSATSTSTTTSTLGVQFSSSRDGKVTAIRYYAASTNTGKTVKLYSSSGAVLGSATTTQTGTGWRTATFATPISITAGTAYTASYYAPAGNWSTTTSGYSSAYTSGPLSVPASGARTGFGDVFPTNASSTNYWVDVLVSV